MLSIRSLQAHEGAWFSSLGEDVAAPLAAAWNDGTGRPDWTLVAEVDGRPLARGCLIAEPVGGAVETLEGTAAFLWADFEHPLHTDAVALLLDALVARLRPYGPTTLERRLNPERHAAIERWRPLLEQSGFELFQEKVGFSWTPDVPVLSPRRLAFASLTELGRDAYRDAMASGIRGTLDRNDRYYVGLCGPVPWADQMLVLAERDDEEGWLVAREPDGTIAGYVAVGAFDDSGTWTIVHVGVVPERRGRGYVDELLAAADVVARGRGFARGLSDVDTVNAPMIAAMERAGHRSHVRPWHVWHYRRAVPGPERRG